VAAPTVESAHRAAVWEARLRPFVLAAALAVIPLVALSLAHPKGLTHDLEVIGHWLVWLVFAVEVVVMLAVVDDRRAWLAGHQFEVLVVVLASPLLPLAVAFVPALRVLIVAKAFKTIKVVKLAKGWRLLRRRFALGGTTGFALGVASLAIAAIGVVSVATDHSLLHGDEHVAALLALGALAVFGLNHLRDRGRATARSSV
jgi:CsoR family transcriptional regulator, copper-sensing transcriptional repressor